MLHRLLELMFLQTGKSIINNTGEAAQTFVNKTASVLGNVTGEVSELFGGKK